MYFSAFKRWTEHDVRKTNKHNLCFFNNFNFWSLKTTLPFYSSFFDFLITKVTTLISWMWKFFVILLGWFLGFAEILKPFCWLSNPAMQSDGNKMGIVEAIAYCVGDIVGSGIFVSPTSVLQHSGSVGMSLIMWALGAVIAVFGGLSYIELGTSIRKSG